MEQARAQEGKDTTLVYGKNAVTELLKSGGAVDTLYVQDTMQPKQIAYYTALAKQAGAVVKRVRAVKLDSMCGTQSHQGVAAWAANVAYVTLEQVLNEAREKGQDPFVLLCDGVEDPHNLGALIRTALLCGVHGVVIPRRGGVSVTATVLKASAGAAARIPIARVANIGQAVRALKKENVFVYCADMNGPAVFGQDLRGPVALVAGSEGTGVSPLVKSLCDGVVSLPMAGGTTGVDSFNVSVATGILLYEIMRQRTQ
ncbi:23S rRNA (guanosine(2251)-2'-O)-methyltransferase RlmB [uncultured Ruthenibacterium sp.]|uniref:23S rRNA (guanosine(2251)-2'-O)-methyltransferase RlmB n=1 Tax=uncultured Ruthenibacterium sp. TaxID=1905347 RepID=UPI00349EC838